MKKMVLVLTLAVFALSGSAFAQGNIGVYLTPEGYLNPGADDGTGSCGTAEENVPFTAFIVLSELVHPEVWGWEAKFIPDNMLFLDDAFYGEGFNAATREYEMIVALNDPLMAVDGAVVVGELQYMIDYFSDPALPSHVFIEGTYFSSIDPPQGPPGVLIAPGGPVVYLHNALGDPDCAPPRPCPTIPQLIINGDCDVVGVEDSTWGSVKSLYR
jgi:hypothetical protein